MTVALPTAAEWARWGVPAEWSRLVDVPERGGAPRRWHVLDTGPPDAATTGGETAPTVLCVHGNPTWAFVWSRVAHALAARHRVVAVDQLGMGYSERTPRRRYADRVADLADVVDALDLTADGPIVVVGHDWGGAIAMGWAVAHGDDLAALVLCNTGIAVPDGRSAPAIIRLAASPFLLDAVCRGTPIFVRGAARLSRGRLSKVEREALDAPYRGAPQRAAVADFVDDIPLRDDAPSADVLDAVAAELSDISAPVLLAWGPDDPVFNDDFLDDLAKRMPHADRHRFPRGGHLLPLEDIGAPSAADVIAGWLDHNTTENGATTAHQVNEESMQRVGAHRPLWAPIDEITADPVRRADRAVVDMASGDTVTWSELSERIERGARALRASGMTTGDRVAMLTPPGVDALVVAYAIVRAGGVAVVADRGLGLSGLRTAVRSSRPKFVVGPRQARGAARVLRWAPGATMLDPGELRDGPEAGELPVPGPDDLAAVLFTSGATGPAKGVRYTHAQLAAQRDALETTYAITADDRLVAAFAPFALYGPGLGITTALPDSDVTRPGTLSAADLSAACAEIDATMAFASPAALANVVRTAGSGDQAGNVDGLRGLRVLMSAGAPVPSELLHDVAQLTPSATLHTPYGMTESLPVADVELTVIDAADADDPHGGVCVGAPVEGAEVLIVPFGFDARQPVGELAAGLMGEILVRSPWTSAGYDGLWATQTAARPLDTEGRRWHRTGDVGHLDAAGRLWVEGRSVHVITAVEPITPVPVERAVERRLRGTRVAAVGIGPAGRQQLAVVIEQRGANGLASTDIARVVRSAVEPLDIDVAAVLAVAEIPVDIRHEAKIDRAAVARWAERVLAGRRVRPLRRH
ncbi:MAG: alpha/beta fold hydrolase [Actinomycetota bacterium]